jgi:NADH:ubiquinone oxidoreductase subunit F (NADH-binding)/(2Fe-2S) ferredoxin
MSAGGGDGMKRIADYKELLALQEANRPMLAWRHRADEDVSIIDSPKRDLLVCAGTGCQASESRLLVEELTKAVRAAGLEKDVAVVITGCFGFCEKGPIVKVHPDNVFYVEVKPGDAAAIVDEHLVGGRRVERLLYEEPTLKQKVEKHSEMSFYRKQQRIALRNCGFINPEAVGEYVANRGYEALGLVLAEWRPEQVVESLKQSGLRGRGGGGFPIGLKWELASKNAGDEKFVVCNADEGDPGAFMDRSIMEGDPHSVIEAMAIAGYAVGAREGYVYIRAEYPLAITRLALAITAARELGMLGKNILGSGFDFDIEIKYGAGAFICGEETALIHSIEGRRGEPTTKPPFPAEAGLWNMPTCVNNVETLANVTAIILNGAEWYRKIGTESSKGTKVFALAGKVNNVGLVEVPMGTTLREIIFEIGGGIRGGKAFKAVQTGGPSGGCIPASCLDTAIDYESLKSIGSMMGSGGMIVLGEDDCMVNIAKYYLEFSVDESCGKCTPCRVGTKRMHEILEKICEGKGTEKDLARLRELAEVIRDTALCGLGQTAPNPVLSTMEYFMDEYRAHVIDRICPSGTCQKLVRYTVVPEKCVGCTACARVCPVSCIAGAAKQVHEIDQEKCIRCGACFDKCKFNAITRS